MVEIFDLQALVPRIIFIPPSSSSQPSTVLHSLCPVFTVDLIIDLMRKAQFTALRTKLAADAPAEPHTVLYSAVITVPFSRVTTRTVIL